MGLEHVSDRSEELFGISGIFTAGSRYQDGATGVKPGDVESAEAGIDTTTDVGENTAWCIRTS
jgi:hypothetical protein